jgi:copper chaperone
MRVRNCGVSRLFRRRHAINLRRNRSLRPSPGASRTPRGLSLLASVESRLWARSVCNREIPPSRVLEQHGNAKATRAAHFVHHRPEPTRAAADPAGRRTPNENDATRGTCRECQSRNEDLRDRGRGEPCPSRPIPRTIPNHTRGNQMQTELMKVTGMTCGGCTSKVTRALKAIGGVSDVDVSLPAGQATIQYDENVTSPAQLKSAVIGAGYGADADGEAHSQPSRSGCCG